MKFNLAYRDSKTKAFKLLSNYSEKGVIVEINRLKLTRSSLQNRALHLYFKMVADELISIGYDFNYTNLFTGEIVEMPFDKDLVKKHIWKPLQEQMFEIESTTKLTTEMINNILTVISNHLAKIGVSATFPNKFDLLIKQLNKHENNR